MLFPGDWAYTCEFCGELHWTPCMISAIGLVTNDRMVVCGTCKGLLERIANTEDPSEASDLMDQLERRRGEDRG